MLRVDLSYTWTPAGAPAGALGEDFFRLLEALHAHGSIAAAARVMGLSYRNVWGGCANSSVCSGRRW